MNDSDVREIIGSTAYGSDNEKIGTVGQVFFDDSTGQPEWVTVNTGLFGTSESFAPLASARVADGGVYLAHTKDAVKDAPNVDLDGGHLSADEERRLYDYYGIAYGTTDATTDTVGYADTATAGTARTGTDDAMTRSEERIEVGTTSKEAGRARLRKYVETEHVTTTVPVRKEKAVLETEPITDGNVDEALSGAPISEEEHEVVLREEKPVVQKVVEPVERVRIGTQQTTQEETVSDEVRKERIVAEGDVDDTTRR
jgi:stress response protein YsnF